MGHVLNNSDIRTNERSLFANEQNKGRLPEETKVHQSWQPKKYIQVNIQTNLEKQKEKTKDKIRRKYKKYKRIQTVDTCQHTHTTTYFIKESINFIFKSGTSGNCDISTTEC